MTLRAVRQAICGPWGIGLLTAGIFLLDLFTPTGWADPILYLLPLAFTYDIPRPRLPLELSAVLTLLLLAGSLLSPMGIDPTGTAFNRTLIAAVIWAFAFGMVNRKQLRDQAATATVGRVQAERRLAESETRFAQLVSEVREYAILMLGPDGRIESWNAGAERLTGYRAEEVLGTHYSRFHRPQDVEAGRPRALLEQALREGRVEDEGWRVRKDGTHFLADVVTTALRTPSGQVIGFAKIVRDVTERNRLQEQFRLAVEAAPSGMLLTDEEGRIQLVNAQIETIFGYPRAELLGQPLEMLVPGGLSRPHQPPRADVPIRSETAEHERAREVEGRRKDGTLVPLEIGLNPIQTLSGRRVLASMVDISERLRAERERRALDERLRMIVNSMEEVVWSSSVDLTQIHYISPSSTTVYGRTPEEFVTVPLLWLTVIHDDDQATAMQAVEQLHRTGQFDTEYRIVRPDGSVRWLHDRGRVIKDETGQAVRIDGIASDITDRQSAKAVLQDSESRFRSTLDSMMEGCQIIGFDWSYLYINQVAARHGRRTREEFLGRTVMEMYPGIERTELFGSLRRCMTDRTAFSCETDFLFPDGATGVFDIKVQPVPEGIFVLSHDVTDRRQAEKAFRESRERSELLIRYAPVALAMFDREMRYLAVSDRWLTDFQLGDASLIGRSYYDVFPDIPPQWKAVHQRGLGGEVVRNDEDRWVRADGSTRWLRWEVRPWHLADGPVGGIVMFAEDIADRKQAELALARLNAELEDRVRVRTEELANANKELRESSRRFRAIFNSTFQFTGLLSTEGRLLEVNQSALEFAGVPASEVLGRYYWETPWWSHSADAQQQLRSAIDAAVRGDFIRFETTNRSFEGTLAVLDFSVKPILDEHRTVVLLVVEGRDITERKRVEDAVERTKSDLDVKVQERTAELSHVNARLEREVGERRAAEQRLRLVVESAPSGIVLVDEAGTIRLVNRRIEEQFGYSRDELIGESVERLIPEPLRMGHVAHRRRYVASPETRPMGKGRELHGLRKDGTEFPIEIGLSPIRMPEGTGVLASVVDITERKRLEAQLRRTECIAELGTLASGMAHEIGTPMNVILGRAEYLLQRSSDETMKKGLTTIVTQVERITRVMKQLLAFARRRSPERRAVDLCQTIEESLEMFRERLGRRRIVVERHIEGSLPAVRADPDQMTQILINLIMNSIHAMPEGGTIRIAARCRDRHVTLDVADTGHGMPPAVVEKIFDPFFTTKDTGEGTGLGLTVVKGIIEEHEGTISVSSEVDKGTTISLSLPVDASATGVN